MKFTWNYYLIDGSYTLNNNKHIVAGIINKINKLTANRYGGGALKRIMIAIPAYNEEKAIGYVIASCRRHLPKRFDPWILVINDGSTDRTVDVAIAAGADEVVSHSTNLGVGMAYRTAIEFAVRSGAKIVCTIDGDAQFDPREMKYLIEPIERGEADLVIGSRFVDPERAVRVPLLNAIGNRLMAIFISILIWARIHDVESGYRALSADAAKNLELTGVWSFSHDMLLDLASKQYRISEVPISVTYYRGRDSRVVDSFLKYGWGSLCAIIMKLLIVRGIFKFRKRRKAKVRVVYKNPLPAGLWALHHYTAVSADTQVS